MLLRLGKIRTMVRTHGSLFISLSSGTRAVSFLLSLPIAREEAHANDQPAGSPREITK